MAKIKNTRIYPYDLDISGDEYLIGSDTDERGKSKNYRIRDIARYVFEGRVIPGINQNNISVLVNVGDIDSSQSGHSIADAVNGLDEFEVLEDEIYYFTGFKVESENFSTSVAQSPPETRITRFLYLFRKGKGRYGLAINHTTEATFDSDFILLNKEDVTLPSLYGEQPKVYFVPNSSGLNAVDAINNSGRAYVISNESDVYFQVSNVGGVRDDFIYRFVGAPGTYGIMNTLVVSDDLLTLKDAGIPTSGTQTIRILEFDAIMLSPNQTRSEAINNLGEFTVSKDELALFKFRRQLPSGSIEKSSWFSKRGAGRYGSTSTIFQTRRWEEGDLVLNERSVMNLIQNKPNEGSLSLDYYILPPDESKSISASINESDEPIVVNSSEHISIIEKDDLVYQFIGNDGVYGSGYGSCHDSDLKELVPFDKHTKDFDISELLDGDNNFTGENVFEKGISTKVIRFLSQTSLPKNPNEGELFNRNGQLVVYLNGVWNSLSLKPLIS